MNQSPAPNSSEMTDEERLARIGALFRKATMLYLAAIDAGEIPPPPEMIESPPVTPPVAPPPTTDGDRIVRYLERHGAAAPKDIRVALGLSRATAQRRLAHLAEEGRIVAKGRTHALLYLLNHKPNGLS